MLYTLTASILHGIVTHLESSLNLEKRETKNMIYEKSIKITSSI